jgi:hypothetical protein
MLVIPAEAGPIVNSKPVLSKVEWIVNSKSKGPDVGGLYCLVDLIHDFYGFVKFRK